MKRFSPEVMEKITSGTDERIDLIADVHTDLNTKQVLEEGVGSPFNIYVIIEDERGRRVCRGAVFSYYEFKHPMGDRLTDEKWQQMQKKGERPNQPDWIKTFTADCLLAVRVSYKADIRFLVKTDDVVPLFSLKGAKA